MDINDQQAFPTFDKDGNSMLHEEGLTKLEYVSALAMQSMLSNPEYADQGYAKIAESAVIAASELLYKLDHL